MYSADDGNTAAAQPNKEEEAACSSSDYGKAMAKLKSGEQKKRTPKVGTFHVCGTTTEWLEYVHCIVHGYHKVTI